MVLQNNYDFDKPIRKFPKISVTVTIVFFVSILLLCATFSYFDDDDYTWKCPSCPRRLLNFTDLPSTSPTNISHLVFGVAASAATWRKRSRYVALWWDPDTVRGSIWLDREAEGDDNARYLPVKVSSVDFSKFKNRAVPSRIAHIVVDAYNQCQDDARMARSSSTATAESSSTAIANWTAERTDAFIDICINHLDDRGSSRFLAAVQTEFNNKFNDDLTGTQMKNKWDNLKRVWRDWNALLQIPGGQWDVQNDRLDGSEEWWLGPARQFQKFRRNAPSKFRELDEMFGGCIGKGTCKYEIPAPSQSFTAADTAMYRDILGGDSPPPVTSRRRQTAPATSSRRRPPFVQTDRFTDQTNRCYSILSALTDNVVRWEIMEIFRTDPSVLDMVEVLPDDDLLGYMSYQLNAWRARRR